MLNQIKKSIKSGNQTEFLLSLHENSAQDALDDIYAHLYWCNQRAEFKKNQSNLQLASMKKLSKRIKKGLKKKQFKPEMTLFGSVLKRFFHPGSCSENATLFFNGEGWKHWVQPESTLHYWHNEKQLKICCYCEGDIVFTESPNMGVYLQEKKSVADFLVDA